MTNAGPVESHPSSTPGPIGFVGLGNMGSILASNLVQSGYEVLGHDILGPDRTPEGVTFLPDLVALARQTEVAVLSLPNGAACERVAREILAVGDRSITHVVDTSTIGVRAAESVAALLAEGGVTFVDAPVSGGVAGARARPQAGRYAGSDRACSCVEPILAGFTDRRHRVGDRPGMAQAMKLANNFLSATSLAATSEAIAFGLSSGLDMGTMLRVLNDASGKSAATSDKFPDHVLTSRYAAGFSNSLMSKDVQLYARAVEETGGPRSVSDVTASVWERFAVAEPGADFTRIFPFVSGGESGAERSSRSHPELASPDHETSQRGGIPQHGRKEGTPKS